MNDILDILKFLIVVIVFSGMIALLVVVDKTIEKHRCSVISEITEKECIYSYFAGCFFKEGDKWVKFNEENAEAQKVYLK